MDLRHLTPDFAVSPQLSAEDMAALKSEGFAVVICNRPAMESGPADAPDLVAAAAAQAGLEFIDNPLVSGDLSMDHITTQAGALDRKAVAYCASGTRSAILWALASAGRQPTEDILAAMAEAGYPMPQLRGQIEMLASRGMHT